MSWAPGTLVVCVDDRAPLGAHGEVYKVFGPPLQVGSYYTIRENCGPWDFVDNKGVCGVRLEENSRSLRVRSGKVYADFPWGAVRFRLAESIHSEAASCRKE